MVLTRQFNPMLRAILVIGAVMVLVTGVTFAFTSSATLTGNTLSSTTASLLVDGSDADVIPTASEQGFNFNNVSSTYSAPQEFLLKNDGSSPLDVNVQITGEQALPAGVNGDDIVFKFTKADGDGDGQPDVIDEATWSELVLYPGIDLAEDLPAGTTTPFSVAVKIDDSVNISSFNIPAFNFTFTGTTPAAPSESDAQ